jgi:hypothetical protein
MNQLINANQNVGTIGQPNNNALHVMADLMWKF